MTEYQPPGRVSKALSTIISFVPSSWYIRLLRRYLYGLAYEKSPHKAMTSALKLQDTVTRGLDEIAIRYDQGIHVKHRLTAYHDFFVQRINADDCVLDIGCGVGVLAAEIAQKTRARVIAIDLHEERIAWAREHHSHKNLSFHVANALDYEPKTPVSVVVLSNVLEHIEPRVDFLRETASKTNATRFLIRVPVVDRDWTVPMRKELGLPFYSDPDHCTEYTTGTFEREISEAGLTIEELVVNWGEIWSVIQRNAS